jgi:hypothetical protein
MNDFQIVRIADGVQELNKTLLLISEELKTVIFLLQKQEGGIK